MARRPKGGSVAAMMRELTIAGGGLAGLSLGIALRRAGVDVHVHEAGNYPRHRVCGEFISGVSIETLETLGIAAAVSDACRNRAIQWFHGDRLIHADELTEPALGISRYRLDQRLSRQFVDRGGKLSVRSRWAPTDAEGLVWAAGRRPRKGDWIGLKFHCLNLPMTADLEMHVGRSGYAGLARIEEDRVNVCGLFRCDRSIKAAGGGLALAYLKSGGLGALAERLASAERDESSFLGAAGFQLGRQPAEPDMLTIGDAESMIPPFTGNGMAMAFQAAEIALAPLLDYAEAACDWGAVREVVSRSLRARFRRRLSVAGAVHPWLMTSAGRKTLELVAGLGCLPFQTLLRTVR